MKQVQIKIRCQVITAQLGTLNTGDIVNTDEAFAKHLVEDCGAAEYTAKTEGAAMGTSKTVKVAKPPKGAKVPGEVPQAPAAEADPPLPIDPEPATELHQEPVQTSAQES